MHKSIRVYSPSWPGPSNAHWLFSVISNSNPTDNGSIAVIMVFLRYNIYAVHDCLVPQLHVHVYITFSDSCSLYIVLV